MPRFNVKPSGQVVPISSGLSPGGQAASNLACINAYAAWLIANPLYQGPGTQDLLKGAFSTNKPIDLGPPSLQAFAQAVLRSNSLCANWAQGVAMLQSQDSSMVYRAISAAIPNAISLSQPRTPVTLVTYAPPIDVGMTLAFGGVLVLGLIWFATKD